MNRFLILSALIFASVGAQFTYCELAAVIGEATAAYECPPPYVYTSVGWCCNPGYILYRTCEDKLNDKGVNECPELKPYCDLSVLRASMINNCPKTCGFCT